MPDIEQMRKELEISRMREELEAAQNQEQAVQPDGIKPIEPSAAEAAVRGGAQGILFGHADEAVAYPMAAKDYLAGKLGLRGDIDWHDAVDTNLNAVRARDAAAHEAHPVVSTVSQLAGGFASPISKVLAPAKGAGMLAHVGSGAAAGALSALGESTAHPFESPEEAEKAGMDVVGGAGLGGLMGAGGKLVGSAIEALTPDSLRKFGGERMVKAATGQNKSAIQNLAEAGAADASGSALDSAGRILGQADEAGPAVVGWLDRAEEIGPKAAAKRQVFGQKIGQLAEEIDTQMPKAVDAKKISQRVLDYAASLPENERTKPVIDRLMRDAERLEQKGSMGFGEAQDWKSSYKFKPMDSSTHTFGQEGSNELNSIFRQEMEKTAQQIGEVADQGGDLKDLAKNYRDLKAKYQAYKVIDEAAKKREVANISNRFVSPSDYGLGVTTFLGSLMHGGHAVTSAALGLGASAANKFTRTRGSAFAGNAANALAAGLEAAPESVGTAAGAAKQYIQSGLGGMGLTHAIQGDPDQAAQEKRRRLREAMARHIGNLREQGVGYDIPLPEP